MMLSHETIWKALDTLAERHQMTPSGLARRAGLDPTSFNKSKRHGPDGRLRWPSTESIAKVLDATGATIEQFIRYLALAQDGESAALPVEDFPPAPGNIPLLGFAQAGARSAFNEAGFPAGKGWDVVGFPADPSRKAGVYALEVQGNSMLPLYRDGDVLIVDPGAQTRRSDRVVVKTRRGELMAKVLVRQSARTIELMSLNPDHPNRSFDLSEVEWIARIVWASQ